MHEYAQQAVAGVLGVPVEQLRAQLLGHKQVDWRVGQMMQPLEAVIKPENNEDCTAQCERGFIKACTGPCVVVVGDFLTQSSFLGCMGTAVGAAEAILRSYEYR